MAEVPPAEGAPPPRGHCRGRGETPTRRGAPHCRPRSRRRRRRRRPARVPSGPGELAAPGASAGVAGIRRRTGLDAVGDGPARRGWGAAWGPAGRRERAGRGAAPSRPPPPPGAPRAEPASGPHATGLRGAPALLPLEPSLRALGGFVVAEAGVVAVWQENVCSAGRSCLSWPFEGNLAKT